MFTDRDKIMLKALNKLHEDASFSVKIREAGALLQINAWLKELEVRMNEPAPKPEVVPQANVEPKKAKKKAKGK